MAGENAIVGDVGLRVNAVDPGLERQIQALIRKLETNANFQVSANTQAAQQNVENLARGVDSVGGAWASAALQVAGFTAAVNIAQNTVNRLLGSFSGLFDQLAQARAGFTSILGSEGAGESLLSDIREFARESPFVTEELVNYSQQLLGVGKAAESIVPLLRNVGDYVASVGGDTTNLGRVLFTLTQIQSIGRLTGQDAIQLQSALIPITKLLADQLDVTTAEVKKLQEQGKITADQVFQALTEAGQNVEGAMNEATRNISGARSVLSDTIQIALQDSPELNRIFQDIVRGILALSNAIGEPEFQANLQRFFEGVGKVYDALQPVIEQLSESAGQSAIFGLRALSGVLESLAFVLNSIPEPALQALTSFLVTLAAIRAPLALINYINQIQTLAGGLLGQYSNQTRQAAAANAQMATTANAAAAATQNQIAAINQGIAAMGRQEGRVLALANQYRSLIGAAAAFAGMQAQQSDSAVAQGIGGVATGAGIGFATAGLPGAVVGGVIGSVTTILNASADAARREAEALKQRAVEVAAEFFTQFESEFENLSSAGAGQALVDEVAGAANVVETYKDVLSDVNAEIESLLEKAGTDNPLQALNGFLLSDEDQDRLEYLLGFTGRLEDQIGTFQAEVNALTDDPRFAEWATQIQTRLGLLSRDGVGNLLQQLGAAGQNPIFRSLILGERAFDPDTIDADYQVLTDTLGRVGITLNDLINLPYEDLVDKLTVQVPSALAEAQAAFDAFTAAVKRAQEVTNINFSPLIDRFQAVQTEIANDRSINDAFTSLFEFDPSGAAIPVEATLQNISAAGKAILDTAKQQAQQIFQDTIATGADEATAIAAQIDGFNAVVAGNFVALQEALQLSDDQFRSLLESAGLWEAYLTGVQGSSDTAVQGFQDYADQLGISAERLAELVRLQGEITPQTRIVVTADVDEAIRRLNEVNTLLQQAGGGSLATGAALEAERDRLQQFLNDAGVINPNLGPGSQAAIAAAEQEADRVQAALFELGRTTSDDYIAYLQTRMAQETELSEEWLGLQREVTQIQTDIENERRRQEEEAAREAEKAAREAERLAREQEAAAERWANAVESATNTLNNTIEQAAEQIAAAAASWVGSIRERTQFEQAVSTSRLTANATRQVNELTELTAGLASLRARGVSQEVLNALGIDNIADLRQVRRLVGSSDADLASLTRAVSERDRLSIELAKSEEDTRQQRNITEGILAAAKALDLDLSREQAASITAQFDVTAGTNAEDVALQILNILTSGAISR